MKRATEVQLRLPIKEAEQSGCKQKKDFLVSNKIISFAQVKRQLEREKELKTVTTFLDYYKIF